MRLDSRITIATPEGVGVEMVLAGLGSRFLARSLDTLIQLGAIIALALLVALSGATTDAGNGFFIALGVVGVFLVLWAYDIVFETLGSGRTPGKRAAGIRVVGRRGEPITFLTSAVRNFVRLLDILPGPYLVGAIAILTTEHSQRLGDLAAGTLVVRENFGGRRGEAAVAMWNAPITVAPEAVATWDVAGITTAEVQVVRHFLARRLSLPWHIRLYLAGQLAARLAPKIVGVPEQTHPEYVLEGIIVAKRGRN